MVLGFHLLAITGYAAAWLIHLRAFGSRPGGDSAPGAAILTTLAAFLAHGGGLLAFSLAQGGLPLVGLGPASSTLAFVIALFLLAASIRAEARPSGLFVLPFVLLLLGEALWVGVDPSPRELVFRGPWFIFHVGAVFLGCAGLLVSSAAALMYLLQFRALKRKKFGSVFRFFPSLDLLDGLNRIGLGVGFPALTLGIIAGWGFTLTYGRGLALQDPEVTFGIVMWISYLVALAARARPDWRPERYALASAGALLLTGATFVVLRLTASRPGFFL